MATVVWTSKAKAMRRKWFPEPLLRGYVPFYRSRHINKRFKLLYWYNEEVDMVVIEDIWDTRRAPQNLVSRIK